MKSVSFIGGGGSGKSTSLGLLCEALTQWSVNNKNFQFEPDILSVDYLNNKILVPLRSGQFPEKTPPGTREEVKLYLRFKRVIGWEKIVFTSYDLSGEEVARAFEALTTAKTVGQLLHGIREAEVLKSLLDSDVFIFVVDGLDCNPIMSGESAKKKAENDLFLQRIWLVIKEYKKRTRTKINGLAIIFSKYDEAEMFLPLGIAEFFSVIDFNRPIKAVGRQAEELQGFEGVAKTYLRSMYSSMNFEADRIAHARYFKSGVSLKEEGEVGVERELCIPLEFMMQEYVNLAKWLSEI